MGLQPSGKWCRARPPTGKLSVANLWKGISTLARLIWKVGLVGNYRGIFWKMAWPALKELDIEDVVHISLVAHHMIQFAREAEEGYQNASFYSGELKATTA